MHGTSTGSGKHEQRQPAARTARSGDDARRAEPGALLADLVVDAAGLPMLPIRRTPSGHSGSRHYVSAAPPLALEACTIIPAARLDRGVVGVLKRIGLLRDDWQHDELVTVLRRVVVHEDALLLQLNRHPCLALWRAHNRELRRAAVAEVLGAVETLLLRDEQLAEVGSLLCLGMPRYSRNRCVHAQRRRPALPFGRNDAVG